MELAPLTSSTLFSTIFEMSSLPTVIPASLARSNFYDLLDEVSKTPKRFVITRRGRAQAVVLSPEEVESWEETLEVMSDKKLMEDIREGMEDIEKGRTYSLDKVIKELKINED